MKTDTTLKGDSMNCFPTDELNKFKSSIELKEEIIRLLEETKREGMDKVIQLLNDSGYFTSPASSQFHLCCEGGLAKHSHNTYLILKHFNDYTHHLTEEEVVIVGLLHDICKVGCYQENVLQSGKISNAKPYKYVDPSPLGHGEKSVMILQEMMRLTDKEMLCIRWHLGPMGNYEWQMHARLLKKADYLKEVTMTFLADHFASAIVEGDGTPDNLPYKL